MLWKSVPGDGTGRRTGPRVNAFMPHARNLELFGFGGPSVAGQGKISMSYWRGGKLDWFHLAHV